MEFTIKQPHISSSNKVVSLTIGAVEHDGEYSASIENVGPIAEAEQKLLTEWTEEQVDALCASTATALHWQSKLDANIAAQKEEKPVAAVFPFYEEE